MGVGVVVHGNGGVRGTNGGQPTTTNTTPGFLGKRVRPSHTARSSVSHDRATDTTVFRPVARDANQRGAAAKLADSLLGLGGEGGDEGGNPWMPLAQCVLGGSRYSKVWFCVVGLCVTMLL